MRLSFIFYLLSFITGIFALPMPALAIGSWSCDVCTDLMNNPSKYYGYYSDLYSLAQLQAKYPLVYAVACTTSNQNESNYGVTSPAALPATGELTSPQNSQIKPAGVGAFNLSCTNFSNHHDGVLCDVVDKTCIATNAGQNWHPYLGDGAWAIADCTSGTCVNTSPSCAVRKATLKTLNAPQSLLNCSVTI